MPNLFAYGSLMSLDIWQNIATGHYQHEQAFLDGYRRVYIKHDCYPVLIPASSQSRLTGIIYLKIKIPDLRRLDAFEGKIYQRKTITITLEHSSKKLKAQAYFLKPQYRYLASGRIWSANYFNQKFKTQFIQTYCTRRWR